MKRFLIIVGGICILLTLISLLYWFTTTPTTIRVVDKSTQEQFRIEIQKNERCTTKDSSTIPSSVSKIYEQVLSDSTIRYVYNRQCWENYGWCNDTTEFNDTLRIIDQRTIYKIVTIDPKGWWTETTLDSLDYAQWEVGDTVPTTSHLWGLWTNVPAFIFKKK